MGEKILGFDISGEDIIIVGFFLICLVCFCLYDSSKESFALLEELDSEDNKVIVDSKKPLSNNVKFPNSFVNESNNDNIGIELKKKAVNGTPSINKNLSIIKQYPDLSKKPDNKNVQGMNVQDGSIFRPFDEVWNPGFMPLDMVFKNVQLNQMNKDRPMGGSISDPRGSKPGPVGPYGPVGPMAAGTGSVMGTGPMGAGDPSSKGSNSGGSKGELKIILLYAPWCGHSKRMLPDYKKVMSEFDGKVINNKKVSVIMYDSEVDKDVMKEYGVNAFPTLFTENDGVRKPFPHRTYEKISEYIKQNA